MKCIVAGDSLIRILKVPPDSILRLLNEDSYGANTSLQMHYFKCNRLILSFSKKKKEIYFN